jgi:cell division protein FtsQ
MTGLETVNEGEAVKPIADPRRREQQPDDAALDELRKAFGGAPDAAVTGAAPDAAAEAGDELDATGPATKGVRVAEETPTQATVQPPVVEPPVVEPTTVSPTPTGPSEPPEQPRIVRIDDYAASHAEPPRSAGAPGPAVDPLIAHPPKPAPAERQMIAIDADDLPDAVYVEGSLETGGSGSIVFIEDDVAADALTPESDRDLRRGIEPRMKERRLAVKRAQGRKRLRWLVALLVVVILAVAALATFGSSLFAIRADQVTITGNVYTNPDRLQAVVDDLVGTPVLVADTQRAERDLEAIPWVEDAKVTTHFPHGVTIEIRERAPVATYQGPDAKFRVLDRDGRVLDVLDGDPIAYVLIAGPDPVDLDPSEIAPQGYKAAAELAKNLTGTVRGKVDHLDVTADGSRLVMYLDDGTEVRFGEARDLFTKLVRLETVLQQNPEREPGTIDVSTSQTTL